MATVFEEAVRLLSRGEFKRGTQLLEKLNRTTPDDPMVLYNLGMAYSEQGRLEDSASALERAVALAPTMANAYAALGFTYARQQRTPEAIQVTRQSLEMDPDNFTGWRNLGGLLAKEGRSDEAMEALTKANALQKDDPQVLYGMALAEEQRDNGAEASRLFKRIIQQNRHPQIVELAEQAMTRIAHREMRSAAGGAPRMDAVMYMVSALQTFAGMSKDEVRSVGFEIALLGRQGLDINDPTPKYQLRSLPGQFSGLNLLSHMHVAFQQIDPTLQAGTNLDEEYRAAVQLAGIGDGGADEGSDA